MAAVDLSREHIIEYCANPPVSSCLHTEDFGNKVVILNSEMVVKFGRAVREGEAVNQDQVFRMLDPDIIRVPRVHKYFHDDRGIGYIVMDFMHGKPIDTRKVNHIEGIRKALQYLASFGRNFPGPLHSDEPVGVLFEDEVPSDYKTLHGLENWINGRQENYISLRGEQCVLCHLDLSSKNMLWLEGGTVCLLDWASAGYYPRYFELAAQLKKGRPDKFVNELLETRAKSFTDDEIRQVKCLIQASNNAQRSAQPKPEYEPPSHSKRYIPGPPIPVAHI